MRWRVTASDRSLHPFIPIKSLVLFQSQAEFSPNVFRTMSGIGVGKNINTVLDCMASFYHTLSIHQCNYKNMQELLTDSPDNLTYHSHYLMTPCGLNFCKLNFTE